MSQSAAPVVVNREGQGETILQAMEAAGPGKLYSQLPVRSAVKRPVCLLSLRKEDLYTVAIAIARSERLAGVRSAVSGQRGLRAPFDICASSELCKATPESVEPHAIHKIVY